MPHHTSASPSHFPDHYPLLTAPTLRPPQIVHSSQLPASPSTTTTRGSPPIPSISTLPTAPTKERYPRLRERAPSSSGRTRPAPSRKGRVRCRRSGVQTEERGEVETEEAVGEAEIGADLCAEGRGGEGAAGGDIGWFLRGGGVAVGLGDVDWGRHFVAREG